MNNSNNKYLTFLVLLLICNLCPSVYCKMTINGPPKVMYIDSDGVNWNSPDQTVISMVQAGYNIIILSFYISNLGPVDMAVAWAGLSNSTKQSVVSYAHSQGAIILVSAGGSTDIPYSMNANTFGTTVGNWVVSQFLDGIDFDLENLAPYVAYPPMTSAQTIQWMISATTSAKTAMGPNSFITHAPQAPYFGPISSSSTAWAGVLGGYTAVYKGAATSIDYLNVQFYNQGSCYPDFTSTFLNSGSTSGCYFPGTSANEIASYGIPLSKIIIGKPVTSSDAGSGYIPATTLSTMFSQAQKTLNYTPGIMGWVWHSPAINSAWLQTIYGNSSIPSTTSSSSTTSQQTTSTTGTTGSITTGGSSTGGSTTGISGTTTGTTVNTSGSNICLTCSACSCCCAV